MVWSTPMENCLKVVSGGFKFVDYQAFDSGYGHQQNTSEDTPCLDTTTWVGGQYQGEMSLNKIVGQIGKVLKVNMATQNIVELMFAKVLVEVNIDQQYCDSFLEREWCLS